MKDNLTGFWRTWLRVMLSLFLVGDACHSCGDLVVRFSPCGPANLGVTRVHGSDFYRCASADRPSGEKVYRFVRASP